MLNYTKEVIEGDQKMKELPSKGRKIPLALDPAYQTIWISLIWLFIFLTFISISTYQRFNWMTVFSVVFTIALTVLKKGTYLQIENEYLQLNYFMGLIKKNISLEKLKRIVYTCDIRQIDLIDREEQSLETFYLTKKKHEKFYREVDSYPWSQEISYVVIE